MSDNKVNGLYLNNSELPDDRCHVWYSPELNELITMINGPIENKASEMHKITIGKALFILVFYVGPL